MRWRLRIVATMGWFLTAAVTSPAQESETEMLLRSWMQQSPAPLERVETDAVPEGLQDWIDLYALAGEPAGRERTKALRALARRSENPSIRAQVLHDLLLDTEQQGREALFIRRYGIFTSGFNRVLYTGSRVIQGNLVAVGQLMVDAAHGLVRPKQATPLNRRLLALEQELVSLSQNPVTSEAEIARLRRAIDRAQADSDMERAAWALEHGQPETALYFARTAKRISPNPGKAERLMRDAESAIAAQRRLGLHSGQAGYPDRKPPIELESASQVRALLADRRGAQGLIALLDAGSPTRAGEPDSVAREMRMLDEWLKATKNLPETQGRWLAAVLDSPRHNPAQQLADARDRAQGQRLRFIFIGPERRGQQVYKAASWAVQSLEAVQTIGVFYLFEVVGRSMLVWLKDPTPRQDLRDALAWNLQDIEIPTRQEQKWVRQWQALKIQDGAFESARSVARQYDPANNEMEKRIDRAEAKLLADRILRLPDGPARESMQRSLRELDPKRADQLEKRLGTKAADAETVRLRVSGQTLLSLGGGQAANPSWQVDEGGWYIVEITQVAPGELSMRFGDEKRGSKGMQPVPSMEEPLKQWAQRQFEMQMNSKIMIEQYARRRFPVELQGGVGAGGIDFRPRLLPIELRGEERLYYN